MNMSEKSFGLQLHITDRCDQKCKHCYIYAGEGLSCINELKINELKFIIDNYCDCCKKMCTIPYMAVTGGDPLLHPQVWELLEYMHENNVLFGILGNPFHLDLKVAQELKELGCRFYQMSLDGLKDTHDFIRKPGSFDATLEKVAVLREAKLKSTIMTTVSKTNINEIPELVDIVVENKVNTFGFARYCPNPDDIDLIPTPEEYRDFLDKMFHKYEYYMKKEVKTSFPLKDHLWKRYLYEKGLFDISEIKMRII